MAPHRTSPGRPHGKLLMARMPPSRRRASSLAWLPVRSLYRRRIRTSRVPTKSRSAHEGGPLKSREHIVQLTVVVDTPPSERGGTQGGRIIMFEGPDAECIVSVRAKETSARGDHHV